jgi:sigma-B regulation protein RsbU (phosphoserine phosphatase)
MESSTMKSLDVMSTLGTLGTATAPSKVLIEPVARVRVVPSIPVDQAISAIGQPENLYELAQRLVTTVSMLWSDVAGADLFMPQGGSGELRGVCNPLESHVLLSAVAASYGDGSNVKVVPVTPSLVAGDRGVSCGATMSVPVEGGDHQPSDGFIIVQRRAAAPDFTSADLDALAALGRGVARILPHVRAPGGRSAAAWFQDDMASAREMQRMFLPRPLESNSAHVRVLAEYLPAFAVGGDFYDVVDLGDGRLLAAIGDVSGKGVTAALMMSRISSELHRLAAETTGPAEMLSRLNSSLPGRMQDDRFVTVVCVLLDVPKRRWVVANAGHVVPLLRRKSGAVLGLAYASGPPIGMMPAAVYEEEVFTLEPKDILLLATDGVFEMFAGHRQPFSTMGQSQLADFLEKAPHDLAEIHKRILATVEARAQGRDDVALLGLELTE